MGVVVVVVVVLVVVVVVVVVVRMKYHTRLPTIIDSNNDQLVPVFMVMSL